MKHQEELSGALAAICEDEGTNSGEAPSGAATLEEPAAHLVVEGGHNGSGPNSSGPDVEMRTSEEGLVNISAPPPLLQPVPKALVAPPVTVNVALANADSDPMSISPGLQHSAVLAPWCRLPPPLIVEAKMAASPLSSAAAAPPRRTSAGGGSGGFSSAFVEAALREAFVKTDEEFAADSSAAMVGSTAVVALVSRKRLWVANCGDSRAVLCRGGRAVQLTEDHKPDREDEMVRY